MSKPERPSIKDEDFPMCVEADSKLGDMAIIIIINVGTFGSGISARRRSEARVSKSKAKNKELRA